MPNGVFLIPILISLGLFAMIFGIVYLVKRENLAMIEKGMDPRKRKTATSFSLKFGLLLVGSGAGLILAFVIDQTMIPHEVEPVAVYFGLLGIGGGLGLTTSYNMERKNELRERNNNTGE